MWYYVSKINNDSITIENSYEVRVINRNELDSLSDRVIGYNRVTKQVSLKTMTDVMNYFIASYKMRNKPVDFKLNNKDIIARLNISAKRVKGIIEVTISDENIDSDIITCGEINYEYVKSEISKLGRDKILNHKESLLNIRLIFNLTGKTRKLYGVPVATEFCYLPVCDVVFKNKDLSAYIEISKLFNIVSLTSRSSELGAGSSLSMGVVFERNNVSPIVDMTDLVFNPDVRIIAINSGAVFNIKLPEYIKATEEYEGYFETSDNFRKGIVNITAKEYYTEQVGTVSELLKGRYAGVENLWVCGLDFDTDLQSLVEYNGGKLNLLSSCSILRDDSMQLKFSELFLDSVYEFLKEHKDFRDALRNYISYGEITFGLPCYSIRSEYNKYGYHINEVCRSSYTIWGKTVNKTITALRNLTIDIAYTTTVMIFPKGYDSEKLNEIIIFLLYAFTNSYAGTTRSSSIFTNVQFALQKGGRNK